MPYHFIHFGQWIHQLVNPVIVDHKNHSRRNKQDGDIPDFAFRYGAEGFLFGNEAHHCPARTLAAYGSHQVIQPADAQDILFPSFLYHLLCFFLHLCKLFSVQAALPVIVNLHILIKQQGACGVICGIEQTIQLRIADVQGYIGQRRGPVIAVQYFYSGHDLVIHLADAPDRRIRIINTVPDLSAVHDFPYVILIVLEHGADIAVYIPVRREDAAAFYVFAVGNHVVDGPFHISGVLEPCHFIILAFPVVDNVAHPLILIMKVKQASHIQDNGIHGIGQLLAALHQMINVGLPQFADILVINHQAHAHHDNRENQKYRKYFQADGFPSHVLTAPWVSPATIYFWAQI